LKLTSALTEVRFPRKFRPREDFSSWKRAEKSEQSWRNLQSWNWIWEFYEPSKISVNAC